MEDLAKMGEEERRIGLGEDTMTEGEEEEMRTKFLKRRESRWVWQSAHIQTKGGSPIGW